MHLGSGQDEVLVAHDLGGRGGHLGRDAGRQGGKRGGVGLVSQKPFPEHAHGERGDSGEGRLVVRVHDEPGHFVHLVGDELFFEKSGQRNIGQKNLRGRALLGAFGRKPGQSVP